MSDAIEVLKKIINESKYYSKEGKYICPMDKLQLDQKKVDTFEKALLALEQKENLQNELIKEKKNKSMLLREYEIWLFQTGKIRVVDLDWHTEFLKQRKGKVGEQ